MSRIVRVFRARAKPGLVEALEQRLRDDVLPEVAATPGLIAYHAGVPHGDSREFLMVTVWEDLDAVEAFAGEDYTQAVLYGDTPELIEDMSLEHYEGVE
jgi:quinol monooxygenase YgiN